MQKKIGLVLLGIGAFLLVAGVLCTVWAPDAVKKTPTDTVSESRLTGTAEKLNPSTGKVEDLDVKILNDTQTDSDVSDEEVVAWVAKTCVVIDEPGVPECVDKDDPHLITNTVNTFASDRYTALAVNDEKYLAEESEPHEGLVNKFPFDTEKKTYQYWDGMLGETVDATFEGTEDFDGLETYEFHIDVPDSDAEIVDGLQGVYSMDKTIWIEPKTGAVIKQAQHEVRTMKDGSPVLDMEVEFTPETIEKNVKDAKSNVRSLTLVTSTVPLVGFIGGGIALLVGAGLVLTGRRGKH